MVKGGSVPVRDFSDIISDSHNAFEALLREAFEAGRVTGRREAAADFRSKIDGLLSDEPPFQAMIPYATPYTEPSNIDKHAVPSQLPGRAVAGSVRPTIERIVRESPAGVTAEEITKHTGLKPNSVRGTLWTLGNSGLATKRNGRWFAIEKEIEAASVEPEEAPLAASHVTPVEGAAGAVEPAPGGGT